MMEVGWWRLRRDSRRQNWRESHRLYLSITATDKISASNLTPTQGRAGRNW
jgi:hypothetical protein